MINFMKNIVLHFYEKMSYHQKREVQKWASFCRDKKYILKEHNFSYVFVLFLISASGSTRLGLFLKEKVFLRTYCI